MAGVHPGAGAIGAADPPGSPGEGAGGGRVRRFETRRGDWRCGAVVYQVFVDRFAPPRPGTELRLRPPRRRVPWGRTPTRGRYLPERGVWSHELDFWGGDLVGLRERLPYLVDLGIDVLYLNPVFEALTNHMYDTWDHHRVDPAYGSQGDLADLVAACHGAGIRIVLDGVFNHVGRGHPWFLAARGRAETPQRRFFHLDERRRPRCWRDVPNLPELALERDEVAESILRGSEAVVRRYLRDPGIDGWRLDVASELGFSILAEITRAVHHERPGALSLGEAFNYPPPWLDCLDGVLNVHARELVLALVEAELSPQGARDAWETLVTDCDFAGLLRSWLVLDNHDLPRLATRLPRVWQQRMARVLQFTLPGSVCLYQGSEVGQKGGMDPANRAPMPWDLVERGGPMLRLHRRLVALRRELPALRVGDCRFLAAPGLFAFLRVTDRVGETVVVAANPGSEPVRTLVPLRDGRLQDETRLRDRLSPYEVRIHAGTVRLEVPARRVLVLQPQVEPTAGGYSPYARMR